MIYLKDGNIPLNLAYDDDIVQEANSSYQLSFKFPLTDDKWNLLRREVFLLADDLHGEQEFFIFEVKKVNGYVQVYAKQVATLLNHYSINTISVNRVPGQTVMTALAGSIKRNCPFTFFSDIMDRHTFNESNVSVMDALTKDKHSIVGQWGGDLVRDKYQVKLLKNGGIENESLFMYKKNLSSYEESENINNLKTRLHLKKTIQGQSEGEADRVIAVTVDSPLIGQYRQIYEADIEVNDQDVMDEATLTAYGQRYFSSTLCDLVENSINLDVKGKSDVSVKLFDTVSVFHERFDVDLRLKITSYHFGPMSKRLKSIGFGKVSQSFGSTVASMVAGSVDKATNTLSASFEQKLQKEIDNANRHFDAEFEKRVEEINDGIEKSKAEAEAYADTIKREISTRIKELDSQFQTNQQEQDRQIEESLRKAGTSTDLANVAKNIAESTQANIEQTRAALTNLVNQSTTKVNQMEQSVGTIRTDVASQARTLLAQAQAQTDLTNRVSTVETLADGTKSTVAELSRTMQEATQNIASVSSRTKTVEDTLNQTRSQYEALTQTVNTQTGQIDSINRKTADLQSGIDGVTERFESLQVGGRNYIRDFGFANLGRLFTNTSSWKFERVVDAMAKSGYHLKATCTGAGTGGMGADFFDLRGADWQGKMMTFAVDIKCSKPVRLKYGCEAFEDASNQLIDVTTAWKRYSSSSKVQFNRWHSFIFYNHTGRWEVGDVLYIRDPQLEDGNIATTPHAAEEDLRSEIATYKRTAEESSAELSRQIQLVDGKAVEAKSYAQQTADAIKTRLESLETYKNEEGTRAEQYLSASRTETAKQLSAERTVISANYVAKSTFEENARDVTQRFESLRVGGRNLIPGTATFSGTHWEKQGTWRLEESLYKGAGILTWVGGMKASPIANISVQSGDTYTFSAYIKKENAGTVYFYLYDEHETWFATANVPRATLIRDVGNNFQRFTITFKVTRSGILKPRFAILSTDEGGFSVAGYQLENGTVATDWSPAPEDQQIYTETKIAEYKTTVDGRFATLQESVDSKANQVDFQSVKETAQLYERIIGSTEAGIKDKVARMVMADSLFQTDVRDAISGTATQVSQLNNSYAIKNLTSAGTVLNQLNLNKDGSVKIDGKLVQITGTTYIQDGVITSAKIASLDAGKITSGYISAERLDANSITATKLKVDRAFFDALAANKLLVKDFFAKDAVVTSIQAVTLSATQIQSGVLKAFNDRTTLDLSTGKLTFNNGSPSIEFNSDTSAIRRVTNGQSQFLKFAYTNGATYTTIGANRRANDESIGTADFTGFQIQSRSTANGGLIDKIYAYTDEFIVDGGGGQYDGIVFKNRKYLYPQLSGMLDLGRLGNRWKNVYSFDYYVGQNAVSLRAFLNAVRACFQQIAYGGMTQKTYDLIKDNLDYTFNKIQ
ncbi:phage tail spike protein [Streptococcus suis]